MAQAQNDVQWAELSHNHYFLKVVQPMVTVTKKEL